MFVKFSCGCVGFVLENHTFVIEPCDLSGEDCWEPLGFYPRNMKDKTYEPLPAEKVLDLTKEMATLLRDGYKFRKIQSLLSR
jgi:hypothetical protein